MTNRPRHALSFDVEEYFHVHAFTGIVDPANWDEYPTRVEPATRTILDILAKADVRATFFVLGHVADRHPRLVRDIATSGHEIASHGYWHERVDSLTPDKFRDDVRRAKDLLQQITGRPVTAYRAPSFSITRRTPWAHPILVEEGYTLDSSMAAGRGDRSLAGASVPFVVETPAGCLTEFPLPTTSLGGRRIPVGGGGYFRLFPEWFTHRALRSVEESGGPFCVYLHPWEFDPEQPQLTAPALATLRHWVGITRAAGRLRRLLDAFLFGSLSDCLASTGLSRASVAA